jgi:membrane associated rhomboid family serine protease
MGIYDREYYRREGPSFLGSFANRGQVCKWLVIINIVVFVIQLISRKQQIINGFVVWTNPFTAFFEMDGPRVFQGEVWRLLTYAFLHSEDTWTHIVFNLLFLWWFGHEAEDLYGHKEFLAFYLVSALLGGVVFALAWKAGIGPPLCVGASGAVTAVMVLFAFHYPSRIILLFFVLPVPIWLLVVLQVAQDTFGFLSGNTGGTAVTVHLAGAGFAALYYNLHWRLLNLWPDLKRWQRQRSRPRLRVYKEDEPETPQQRVPVTSPPAADLDEQLEAKLDAVLEKVARSGQASLTENERQILLRASEIYKRRRS